MNKITDIHQLEIQILRQIFSHSLPTWIKMKTLRERQENIISCTESVHHFCNIFGYANISRRCSRMENIYNNIYTIIKVMFIILSVYGVSKRFGLALFKDRGGAAFFTTLDLLNIFNAIAFHVEIFCNTINATKIRNFWLNLRAVEEDLKEVGIKLNHKRFRITALTTVVFECIVMCIFFINYMKILVMSESLEHFISSCLTGKFLRCMLCMYSIIFQSC